MPKETEFQIFCSNVLALRKKNGLTQKEMAAIMGIGVSSLRKLESGSIPPRLTMGSVFSLAEALSLAPSSLFR